MSWLVLLAGASACGIHDQDARATHVQVEQPYVVVVERGTGEDWVEVARTLAEHRGAELVAIARGGFARLAEILRPMAPAYVALVVPPERIEDSFVGAVFESLTRLDEDPQLDCAYGYLTGRTAEEAAGLVANTIRAERERGAVRRKFTAIAHTFANGDLAGFASQQAAQFQSLGYEAQAIVGVDDSEEWLAARESALERMAGSSLVFAAGHGLGNWMCAIEGGLLRDIPLDAAVVVNGTCHSATTTLRHDIDPKTFGIVSVPLDPAQSVALNLIADGAVAIVASTASSSWMNVGLAVDGFLHAGQSVGESLRDRLNGSITAAGVKEVEILPFIEGEASPQFLGQERDPQGLQSLARVVLLGDPAYRPFPEPLARPERERTTSAEQGFDGLSIVELIAELESPRGQGFGALQALIARGAEAVPALVEALAQSDNWQIAKALGAIGEESALEGLITKLESGPALVMERILIEALERITQQKLEGGAPAWRSWYEGRKKGEKGRE